MADIVISEFMDEDAVGGLAADFDVLYDPELVDRPQDLTRALADCRGLIVRNRTQVREALLDAGPRLKVIGRLGVGLDNIDLEACRRRGIEVMPATGANVVAVAEYVIAGVLVLLRGVFHASEAVRAGKWPRTVLAGREANGKRLGLVGFGAIARDVARRAAALGMRVAAYDPYVEAGDGVWNALGVQRHAELAGLLAESDAASVHVPLTPETRHLIGARALAAMKPEAVLINTARGGVVDEEALVAALEGGRLGGALLDVFETEPLPAGAGFDGVPNLILTPHIAGITREANVRVGALVAASVRRVLETAS